MRAVIQRVNNASVTVSGKKAGEIGKGLLVLLGIEEEDGKEDIDWLSAKIVKMRIFEDRDGIMNLSVQDAGGDILVVSQFTLHASTKKGNRPSYIKAARPETALSLYNDFVLRMENDLAKKIQTGRFGADMKVSLENNGPVTIIIDTKNKE